MKKKNSFDENPQIKHVVHSNNVCTILWEDGVKTQSICHKDDSYNKDVGFLVAYLKRFMPTEEIIELIERWSHSQPKQEEVQASKKVNKQKKQQHGDVRYEEYDKPVVMELNIPTSYYYGFDGDLITLPRCRVYYKQRF